ncbi:MAG: hypothetical protein ACO3JF_00590 [Ilumatobacteraceae bacterium]
MPSHREEEKEEVSDQFLRLHRYIWRTIGTTVESLRRQAPGARMIGEFAVKHAVNEAQRRVQPHNKSTQPSDATGDQQP